MAHKTISLIGAGRVGSTLALALRQAGHRFDSIVDGDPAAARETAERTGAARFGTEPADDLGASDVIIMAVPDGEIRAAAERLAAAGFLKPGQVLCHTSGFMPASELAAAKAAGALTASFHPMFSVAGRFSPLPDKPYFGLEGQPEAVLKLRDLAEGFGWSAVELEPSQKALYHAACVLATGMSAALLGLSQGLFRGLGFGEESPGMVRSLSQSAAANVMRTGMAQALTGPLVRGQAGVVAGHLRALEAADPRAAAAYRALGLAMLGMAGGRVDKEAREKMERMLRSE